MHKCKCATFLKVHHPFLQKPQSSNCSGSQQQNHKRFLLQSKQLCEKKKNQTGTPIHTSDLFLSGQRLETMINSLKAPDEPSDRFLGALSSGFDEVVLLLAHSELL